MKYLFIGDIHTYYELFQSAVDYGLENDYTIISIGDYVDAWRISRSSEIEQSKARRGQVKALDLAKWLNDNGHHALIGNHELSYLHDSLRCSGYQGDMAGVLMHKIKDANLKNFKLIDTKLGDPILITHAGLNKQWINQVYGENYFERNSMEDLKSDLSKQCQSYRSPIYDYTHMDKSNPRPLNVGKRIYGGIFWNRPREFEPIDELRQIFGHSKTISAHFSGNKKVAGIYNFEGRKKDLPSSRNFNIDNMEYGLGELLTYNEDTDRFNVITKEEYHGT